MLKEELNNLFNEFDTDTLVVSDFGLLCCGIRVDNIHRNDKGDFELWAGNLDTDKFAEELLPSKEEKKTILEQILEYY